MALGVGLSYAKSLNKPARAIEEEINTILMFARPDRRPNLYDYVSVIRPTCHGWFHGTTAFFLCIQDQEALSTVSSRESVRKYAYELAGVYLAHGVDREENFFMFLESDVPEVMEIAGVLECLIQKGDWRALRSLDRRSRSRSCACEVIPFPHYPIIQAAQCLSYRTDAMILPKSELALLEWTSALGERFHGLHAGDPVFQIPGVLHPMEMERPLRALDDPRRAMGDTGAGGCIYLLDPLAVTARKFRKLVLEEGDISYDPHGKPVISNLLALCRWATGFSYSYITGTIFADTDHEEFKKAAKEMAYLSLRPIQRNYKEVVTDEAISIELEKGARRARSAAGMTCQRIREVLGKG